MDACQRHATTMCVKHVACLRYAGYQLVFFPTLRLRLSVRLIGLHASACFGDTNKWGLSSSVIFANLRVIRNDPFGGLKKSER